MPDRTFQLALDLFGLYRKPGRGAAEAPGPKRSKRPHPNTRAAGEQAARQPGRTRTQRERILVYLLRAIEGTRREIAEGLGILENSAAHRLRELEGNLLIRRDGLRLHQGYECERWVLTDDGRIAAVKVIEETLSDE